MNKHYTLPGGVVRIISGYAELSIIDKLINDTAETVMSDLFSCQGEKDNCIRALKSNIINRKKYPANYMIRKYDLNISVSTFKRLKYQLCYELAQELNLTDIRKATTIK